MGDVWEFASSFSDFIHRQDKIRILKEQIAEEKSLRCGNCERWMKSTCYREKQLKEFKSSGSVACSDFSQKARSVERVERLTKQLQIMEQANV